VVGSLVVSSLVVPWSRSLVTDIAHFISYTGTAMGGPVLSAAAYFRLLAEAGYPVTVFSATKPTDGESVGLDARVRLVQEKGAGWGTFRRCPALWRQAQESEMDLVHSYGLWTDVNRLAGTIARRRRLPHLLAPCGMLAPGALRHHGWKKALARFWFQDRALRGAQCLHAKSPAEYEDLRRFGLRNPVAIIANPVGPGPRDDALRDNGTRGKEPRAEIGGPKSVVSGSVVPWSIVPGRRTVLFLGRLHPVKGVRRLVEAWTAIQNQKAESRKQKAEGGGQRAERSVVSSPWSRSPVVSSFCDWQLVVAGPDEVGMRSGLEGALREEGCKDSVIFTGQLDEQQKWAAYGAAALFVMPSDFENFGNAIVEAMGSGLPVITTTGTPWKELPAEGVGWCVAPTVDDVAGALREALAMPEEQRLAMGRRAAGFAKRFRPEQVAADLIQVYQWLLRQGERPGCVVL